MLTVEAFDMFKLRICPKAEFSAHFNLQHNLE